MKSDIEIEANYIKFWKDIVENPDGTINKKQLMRELSDFTFVMDEVPKVYDEITGGMLSKINYYASGVIEMHNVYQKRMWEERKQDDLRDGECSLCHHQFSEEEIDDRQSQLDYAQAKRNQN